jgi:hypothetical protein
MAVPQALDRQDEGRMLLQLGHGRDQGFVFAPLVKHELGRVNDLDLDGVLGFVWEQGAE